MWRRLPLIDGDEQDALTRTRRFYHWRAGQVRRIKRRVSKRERRFGRAEALRDASTADYPTRLSVRFPAIADNGDSLLVWCSPAEVWLSCCGAHLIDHDDVGIERLALDHWRTHHQTLTRPTQQEAAMTEPQPDDMTTEPAEAEPTQHAEVDPADVEDDGDEDGEYEDDEDGDAEA
ncbi:hypothetical protein ACQP04_29085 [Pseudonocardia halophobica]|uniref:hypothetical protein n=1 Tax=Pseudonocardia halophobica TaxID=29401 RepID=UPI003D89BBF0